jgi:2-methylaconitate cis-trans-isomerase PrpF
MRGGTSKAVILNEAVLPANPESRDALILRIFGSPDKRQIDGLGGADPLTSKVAIIGRPAKGQTEVDLTYTFGQVEIDRPEIDYRSLCGNITSAVGAYAIYEGLVPAIEPVTTIKIHNTNLKRTLRVEVPVAQGRPVEEGDYEIPGVPGTGAPIFVDFADTAGAATGTLLPTGNPVDRIDVPGLGSIDMSLVDIGNVHVFVRASDIGLKGTESAAELDADKALLAQLEAIRAQAALRMGMISEVRLSRQESPAVPILGLVSPPQDYKIALTGKWVKAEDIDLVSRLMFMQQTHKTYAGTSTVCTGVARNIEGTIVAELGNTPGELPKVRIGHPGGVVVTEVAFAYGASCPKVVRATLGRTARRIMQGQVFVP